MFVRCEDYTVLFRNNLTITSLCRFTNVMPFRLPLSEQGPLHACPPCDAIRAPHADISAARARYGEAMRDHRLFLERGNEASSAVMFTQAYKLLHLRSTRASSAHLSSAAAWPLAPLSRETKAPIPLPLRSAPPSPVQPRLSAFAANPPSP